MDDDRYPYLYESKFPSPMNKSVLKARTRAVYIGLAMLAALGCSCTRKDAAYTDGTQAEGAITQARSFYESSAAPLTRSMADQTIAIKPLPGDMTPLWDRATATVLSDGVTAWVDVPITASITYTAVRGGAHHHEAGEECNHDHTPVRAVQKLSVYASPDGTKQSLVATCSGGGLYRGCERLFVCRRVGWVFRLRIVA